MGEVMLRKGAKTDAAVELLGIDADGKAEMMCVGNMPWELCRSLNEFALAFAFCLRTLP